MGMSYVFVFRMFNHNSSLADTILGVRFFCSERRGQGVEKYLKHKQNISGGNEDVYRETKEILDKSMAKPNLSPCSPVRTP